MSIRVVITLGIILFLLLCLLGARVFLSFNEIRLAQKDRTYIYNDMRPQRQSRTTLLNTLIASHKGESSDQQQGFLAKIEPALQRDTANEREKEIPLLNLLIPTVPSLLASYGNVRQKNNQEKYDAFVKLTQELAPKKRRYNMRTKQYNTRLSLFPGNLISMTLGIKEENIFVLTDEETQGVPAETIR